MRLVKKTEYDYDYWTERFELKMASGELKEITVKPLIRRCGYTETFNPEKTPSGTVLLKICWKLELKEGMWMKV